MEPAESNLSIARNDNNHSLLSPCKSKDTENSKGGVPETYASKHKEGSSHDL